MGAVEQIDSWKIPFEIFPNLKGWLGEEGISSSKSLLKKSSEEVVSTVTLCGTHLIKWVALSASVI